MLITSQENVQFGMIPVALEDAHRVPAREDSRWNTFFGPNADPKLATKLFREDFAEYRRLKNVADFQQGRRR
jgi:hypothetical protein